MDEEFTREERKVVVGGTGGGFGRRIVDDET